MIIHKEFICHENMLSVLDVMDVYWDGVYWAGVLPWH